MGSLIMATSSFVLMFVSIFAIIFAILVVVLYIQYSIGLMKIANSLGYRGWLSWIPIINTYLLVQVAYKNNILKWIALLISILSLFNLFKTVLLLALVYFYWSSIYKIYKMKSKKPKKIFVFSLITFGLLVPSYIYSIRNNETNEIITGKVKSSVVKEIIIIVILIGLGLLLKFALVEYSQYRYERAQEKLYELFVDEQGLSQNFIEEQELSENFVEEQELSENYEKSFDEESLAIDNLLAAFEEYNNSLSEEVDYNYNISSIDAKDNKNTNVLIDKNSNNTNNLGDYESDKTKTLLIIAASVIGLCIFLIFILEHKAKSMRKE